MPGALAVWARRAGLLLAVAGCAWLTHGLLAEHRSGNARWPGWGELVLAALACALAISALAIGWAQLLRSLDPRCDVLAAMRAYALSQPAKYLPGNVAHFGARHLMGRSAGLSHRDLLWATALESMVLIGCALAGAGFGDRPWPLPVLQQLPLSWLGALLLVASVAVVFLVTRRAASIPRLVAFMVCAAAYFLLTTVALSLLAGNLAAFGPLLPGVTLSWIAGYLVIGAPGGVGVRESVLAQMLPGVAGAAMVVTAAVTFRVSLILGEALLFALASLSAPDPRKP